MVETKYSDGNHADNSEFHDNLLKMNGGLYGI